LQFPTNGFHRGHSWWNWVKIALLWWSHGYIKVSKSSKNFWVPMVKLHRYDPWLNLFQHILSETTQVWSLAKPFSTYIKWLFSLHVLDKETQVSNTGPQGVLKSDQLCFYFLKPWFTSNNQNAFKVQKILFVTVYKIII